MVDNVTELVFRKNERGLLEFVGDFEQLYTVDPDPWAQSGLDGEMSRYYFHSRARLVAALKRHLDDRQFIGLEVGCGHGHVVNMLEELFDPSTWDGMDISRTAIAHAHELYPDPDFYVGDITKPGTSKVWTYDVVILGQVLWYILHRLDIAVENCHHLLGIGGKLVISQAFLEEQHYGREVIDGFAGLVQHFLTRYWDRFGLIEAQYDDTRKYIHNDGVLVFRKV